METTLNKQKTIKLLSIYIPLFYLTWATYAIFIFSHLKDIIYVGILVKLCLWTLPVCLIIHFVNKENILSNLKLGKANPKIVFPYLLLFGGIILIWNVSASLFLYKKTFSFDRGYYSWIGAVVLIGFTEEIVFRGFILQNIKKLAKYNTANILTSILFVLIHFPGWYANGLFKNPPTVISSMLFIFSFSYLMGYAFKKTNSLWTCIFLHSLNNFITVGFGL